MGCDLRSTPTPQIVADWELSAHQAEGVSCADCHGTGHHLPDGDHEVRTAWGFLAVRTDGLAPYPGESEQWWADRVTILQGLGVLDPDGQPIPITRSGMAGARCSRI